MKNKLFSVSIVIVILVLALSLLMQEQFTQKHVDEINKEINDLKYNLYLLNLRASSLIEEMEMLNFNTVKKLRNGQRAASRAGVAPQAGLLKKNSRNAVKCK